jgi:hypothetical protein
MFGLKRGEKMYFISAFFYIDWQQFLLGNGPPPMTIDNSMLVLRDNDPVGRLIPKQYTRPLLHPELVPLHHIGIISEVQQSNIHLESHFYVNLLFFLVLIDPLEESLRNLWRRA